MSEGRNQRKVYQGRVVYKKKKKRRLIAHE